MSLKNLVRQAKKSQITDASGIKSVVKNTFASSLYDLPESDLSKTRILHLLGGYIDTIRATDGDLPDQLKKDLILELYRIAFAQESRATGCFHPSEISTEKNLCHRKLYFQKGEVPNDVTHVNFTSDNRMMRLVNLGSLVHLYIQENLQRRGILVDYETVVDAPKYGISGKMDGEVMFVGRDDYGVHYEEEKMALEIKTISEYGFKALRRPKPEHIKQASLYGYFLDLKRIVFIYYNKNTSELKTYVEDVDVAYVESFKLIALSIIQRYNKNVRLHRTSDVSKHVDIPDKICPTRTSPRAMVCELADYCFKHRTK